MPLKEMSYGELVFKKKTCGPPVAVQTLSLLAQIERITPPMGIATDTWCAADIPFTSTAILTQHHSQGT
ncbi:hypothetical protein KIN20_025651 [Parelaphostrongylus tenuis]|uniref:Uncharacterized protein n=1 Tax=Parelaphostrongylus tenuis TaxID=148309 RepID=A0AAD5NAX6_PARTN|nr:hypothetical protein KIN20_025651 [Parelaphostrongylus tenuis]